VREREDANRTRAAGNRDEVEGDVANSLKFSRNWTVGFIGGLGIFRRLRQIVLPLALVRRLRNGNAINL
jgi:hypothetical protein